MVETLTEAIYRPWMATGPAEALCIHGTHECHLCRCSLGLASRKARRMVAAARRATRGMRVYVLPIEPRQEVRHAQA